MLHVSVEVHNLIIIRLLLYICNIQKMYTYFILFVQSLKYIEQSLCIFQKERSIHLHKVITDSLVIMSNRMLTNTIFSHTRPPKLYSRSPISKRLNILNYTVETYSQYQHSIVSRLSRNKTKSARLITKNNDHTVK